MLNHQKGAFLMALHVSSLSSMQSIIVAVLAKTWNSCLSLFSISSKSRQNRSFYAFQRMASVGIVGQQKEVENLFVWFNLRSAAAVFARSLQFEFRAKSRVSM